MSLAVVIVTWNGEQWLADCLASLVGQDPQPSVIIIDNGSSDHTMEIVDVFRETSTASSLEMRCVRLESNMGFTAGANRGLELVADELAGVELVLLLNQDTILEEGCLEALCNAAREHPGGGAFGAKTLYPQTGTIQHAGGYLDRPRMVGLHFGHHEADESSSFNELREVDYVTGAAMLLRSSAIAQVGRFNEVFSPGYYEDVELCDRLTAGGWSVLFVPSARLVHHESSTFSDRHRRLRLAHRNRYIYLLPQLVDGNFRHEFLQAELEFLANNAHFDEVRAIRSATIGVLAQLPMLSHRRIGAHAQAPDILKVTAGLLVHIAHESANVLLTRIGNHRSGPSETK